MVTKDTLVRVKKIIFPILLAAIIIVFYSPFLIFNRAPIPTDSLVGLYHPFRDFYSSDYPRGIPFKNFLITDPVRQTYVWKELSVNILKKGELPSWNPYEMTGKPLVGNIQSSAFYPLNILFFIFPISISWGVFIVLQTVLACLFMYLYLKNLKLNSPSCALGSLAFSFCGFCVSWLTWGNVVHTALWLPLILLGIDHLTSRKNRNMWAFVITVAFSSSFLAGHTQSFLYVFLVACAYFILKWRRDVKTLLVYLLICLGFGIVTFIQWYPALLFVVNSARATDRQFYEIEGWFIPWRNLAQFIAPDYFGNPATLNYVGVFNYAEFVGYIGIIPLLLAFFAFTKKNKTTIFMGLVILLSLVFSLPTGVSALPFIASIPFLSSAQPTRLIFLACFGLAVLSAYGLNNITTERLQIKRASIPILLVGLCFIVLFYFVIFPNSFFLGHVEQAKVALRNLMLPFGLFLVSAIIISINFLTKSKKVRFSIICVLFLLTSFDMLRFAQKFTPFSQAQYLYPTTKSLNFLQSQKGIFRVAMTDHRILAPNFLTHYKIQSIEGYDPLYLNSYAEYIASMERDKPNSSPPFGFNRIITPHNYNSQMFYFMNVTFVLSIDPIDSPKLVKVFEEGETKIYKNLNAYPRAYFVKNTVRANESIKQIFSSDLKSSAVVEGLEDKADLSVGDAIITKYSENSVEINTYNKGAGFLVLSDAFYPTWKMYIDGNLTKIYKTNHAFRGVYIQAGNHTVLFKDSLF